MAIRILAVLDKHGKGLEVAHLGSLTIANDGSGSKSARNYTVTQHGSSDGHRQPKNVKFGTVTGHYSAKQSIWALVVKALSAVKHNDDELLGRFANHIAGRVNIDTAEYLMDCDDFTDDEVKRITRASAQAKRKAAGKTT